MNALQMTSISLVGSIWRHPRHQRVRGSTPWNPVGGSCGRVMGLLMKMLMRRSSWCCVSRKIRQGKIRKKKKCRKICIYLLSYERTLQVACFTSSSTRKKILVLRHRSLPILRFLWRGSLLWSFMPVAALLPKAILALRSMDKYHTKSYFTSMLHLRKVYQQRHNLHSSVTKEHHPRII